MHAATDIGSAVDWLQSQVELNSDENGCLAVLHNRNKMVATFGNSEWVTQSDRAVQSKSVTSCAGMTAPGVGAKLPVAGLTQPLWPDISQSVQSKTWQRT